METYPTWIRLHPDSTDETMVTSVQARIHDPLWLLGRQWQFGELRHDGGATPIDVRIEGTSSPLTRLRGGARRGIGHRQFERSSRCRLPLETLVEREAVPETGLDNLRLRTEAGLQFVAHVARRRHGRPRGVLGRARVRSCGRRRTWMPRHGTGSTWWTAACQMVPHSPVSSVPGWPRRAVRQSTRTKRESSARG